jgi:hypothetical protein
VKLQLPRWCGAVDTLTKRDERNAEAMQFFDHRDEMPKIATKTVEPPAHQHIEPPSLGIED